VVCHVGVDVLPYASPTVYVDAQATGVQETAPSPVVASSSYPNPFQRTTSFRFSLSEASSGELAVFDPRGRLVKLVARQEFPAGTNEYSWDGTDNEGQPVSAGVYLFTLTAGESKITQKIVVLK
jgi:flagellar hook assembly protein FlgD